MKKLVVFDLDGVLRDFEGALLEQLAERFGGVAYLKRHLYSFYERFASHPAATDFMERFVADPMSYVNLPSIDPMIDFAYDCMENYDVLFLSSCPQGAWRKTILWLRDQGLDVANDQVYCGVKNKTEWLSSYTRDGQEVEFVVEDSPDNIKSLQNAGFRAYAWSQPWNEGVFPRLEASRDGEIMVWATPDTESFPFTDLVEA